MATENKVIGLRSLPRRQVVITMAGVMLAMFLSSLDQTIVSTAMPTIITDLGGFTQYTWVTTAYLITSTIALPITGKLTDMYGRKYFYVVGIVIFTLGSLLCGLSQSMTQIIIFRGFQGIGAGIMMANAFTVIGDLFPPAERGKFQGIISAVFGVSSVIGPPLGGLITDGLSWHWIFFVNVPLGIIVVLLFLFYFPHFRPDVQKHRVDYPGMTALVLAVVPLMLALTWGGVEYPWGSIQIIGLFAFSAVMALAFLIIESVAKEPIIPLSLFRNQIVSVSELVVFLTGFVMFGTIIFIPLFFQGVLGLSATTSGSFLTPMMLGLVFGSFVSGQMLSRTGGRYRMLGAGGLVITAIGVFLLSRMTVDSSYAAAVMYIVVGGFGLGITLPLYIITVQNAVPYSMLGVATSSTAFFRTLGGSVGLAVFGSIMNNRFAVEFMRGLPPAITNNVPAAQLDTLSHNPQALLSADAQSQLKGLLGNPGPQGAALFDQVLQALRHGLQSALSQVFLIALVVLLVSLVIHLLIKEIPLRKQHAGGDPAVENRGKGKG
ncbi:MAG: MDR family MFS transporter [Dehalococcoidia bacterium]|nr:MDR family MFS transporter [Dehalococcoidia bacterium]